MAGFGGAVKLTGESEYRKALKQIQTNLKEVSSEMKLVSAQYDKNDTSTDALKAKSEALARSLQTQKSALSTLESQYSKLSSEQEKNKSKHDALVAEYEQEKAKLQMLGETLGTNSDEYKAQAQVVSDLARDVDKSSTANERNEQTLSSMRTEMNNLKTSIAGTESEMTKADSATDELADSTKNAGNEARDAGDGFTVFKGVLSDLASSAITSAMNGLKNLGGAMINVGKQAITSYADYEQLVGGVETLFGESAGVVQEYASQAYRTAGLSANEYMESVTSFSASLIGSLGGDTAKASEYANRAITDMSDNANKMGTDMETIIQTYQSLSRGNFQMLDSLKLGYGGTKAELERLIADASKMTDVQEQLGITVDESSLSFDNIVNAISVMQTSMGIAGTTAKEASTTISGSLASAGSAWQNLLTGIADDNADFGKLIDEFVDSVLTVAQNLLPRIQTTIMGLGNLVKGLLEKLVPEIIKTIPPLIRETLPILLSAVQTAIQSILGVLPEVISAFSELIPTICSTIISLLPEVLSAGIQILVSLINGISSAIPELLNMLPSLITDIYSVITDNLGLILEAGIGLLNALIEGITEAIPELLDQMPIICEKLTTALLDNLPLLVTSGIQLITALLNGIIKATPKLIAMMPKLVVQTATAFIDNFPKIIDAGADMIDALVKGVKSVASTIGNTGADIIDWIVSSLGSLPSSMINIGKNAIRGLWNGLNEMKSWVINKVKGMGTSILNGIKNALGIHSPSTVFRDQVGKNIALGIGEGFSDEMAIVASEMQNAIPTSFNTDASLTASGLPTNSLASTGGYATTALVEAFKTAMQGMEIEMGEDGFAKFVVKTISNEIYQ